MSLKQRIQKLESNVSGECQDPLIIQWNTPGPLVELISGDRSWQRRTGEDEDIFVDRVLGVTGKVPYLWGTTDVGSCPA